MYKREVSYVYDGDTFVGRDRVSAHGRVQSVSVKFEQKAVSARIGPLSEEFVARSRLAELVRAKFAAKDCLDRDNIGSMSLPWRSPVLRRRNSKRGNNR